MASKIPIKYINSTGNVDFEVVVFTKNYSTDTPKTYYVAWHVLKAQTSSEFVYPVEIEIGASYHFDDQLITAGPFGAKLGSSWLITQDTSSETATLKESIVYSNMISFHKSYSSYRNWCSCKSQQYNCCSKCPSSNMEWSYV